MKKSKQLLLLFFIACSLQIFAQHNEKVITNPHKGEQTILTKINNSVPAISQIFQKKDSPELIWEYTEASSICRSAHISDETYDTFIGWHVNNYRWAYHKETNIPVWEYSPASSSEDLIWHDITPDGSRMVACNNHSIFLFDTISAVPIWTYDTGSDVVYNVVVSDDAETIYFISGILYTSSKLSSINIETSVINWTIDLPNDGYVWGFVLSGNGEKLAIQHKHWITACDAGTGDILLQTEDLPNSQIQPALSYDGQYLVLGDQRGYVRLYTYLETPNVYSQTWFYQYPYNTYYNWATAVAISTDGSTVAAGSLNFDGDDEYSGTIAVFNSNSSTPLWTYDTPDDEISGIDISEDGSIITATSWGPINDEGNDFWALNKDTGTPFFEYNCTGSSKALALSADGTKCIVGGKAVHARVSGHGGKLYYFDLSLTLYSVSGTVTDADTSEPIEGAVITIGTSYTNTTNSSGFYNIEDVTAGTYTLTCELTGYETYITEINVEGDETIDIELQNSSGIDNPFALQKNISVTNYPNPFKSETTISYNTLVNNIVSVEIYDIQGKKIKTLVNEYQSFGEHSVVWNGTNETGIPVGTGIYFYRLKTDNNIVLKKIILIK